MCPVASRRPILGLCIGLLLGWGAAPSPAQKAVEEPDPVLTSLLSDDPAEAQDALEDLRADLSHPPQVGEGHPLWVEWNELNLRVRQRYAPALFRAERFEMLEELSTIGIAASPVPETIDVLMGWRARALLRQGKYDKALASAKGFYNAVSMKYTPRALQLVGDVLSAIHPDDPTVAGRFKLQQLYGAALHPEADGGTAFPYLLEAVSVDPVPFDVAIERFPRRTHWDAFKRGNLHLLADRPEEARKEFETALEFLQSNRGQQPRRRDVAIARVQEGIARSIRAADGRVGRANAYLFSLQDAGAEPSRQAAPE